MFWEIFLALYIIYAIFIVRYINRLITVDLKFTEFCDPNLPAKYLPFQRYDRKNWNLIEIYLGAIFLLPIRLFLIVISLLLLGFYIFARYRG